MNWNAKFVFIFLSFLWQAFQLFYQSTVNWLAICVPPTGTTLVLFLQILLCLFDYFTPSILWYIILWYTIYYDKLITLNFGGFHQCISQEWARCWKKWFRYKILLVTIKKLSRYNNSFKNDLNTRYILIIEHFDLFNFFEKILIIKYFFIPLNTYKIIGTISKNGEIFFIHVL